MSCLKHFIAQVENATGATIEVSTVFAKALAGELKDILRVCAGKEGGGDTGEERTEEEDG